MTTEEYLRACGWNELGGIWQREDRGEGWARIWTIDEALQVQLAEDRARLAFVLNRGVITATWADGRSLTVDLVGASIKWTTPPVAEASARTR